MGGAVGKGGAVGWKGSRIGGAVEWERGVSFTVVRGEAW